MKSILIIDDDAVVRQSLVDYFEDQLWQIFEAEHVESAKEFLRNHTPDAIIVDVRLPGQPGTEFLRDVMYDYPKTVFVICTGSPGFSLQDDLQSMKNVANRVFTKPITDMFALEQELMSIMKTLS